MTKHKEKPFTNIPRLKPQHKILLDHFKTHGSITNLEAIFVHKIMSVQKRISELKRDFGYDIYHTFHRDAAGTKYYRYYLNPEEALDDAKIIGD